MMDARAAALESYARHFSMINSFASIADPTNPDLTALYECLKGARQSSLRYDAFSKVAELDLPIPSSFLIVPIKLLAEN